MSRLRTNKTWNHDKFTDDSGTVWKVHKREKCGGSSCCIHSPSEHPLNTAKIVLSSDGFKHGLAKRFCECGIGHSDPDSVAYFASIGSHGMGIHGCCGHCNGTYEEIQLAYTSPPVDSEEVQNVNSSSA